MTLFHPKLILLPVLLLLFGPTAMAAPETLNSPKTTTLALAGIFADNMVIQQQTQAAFWGKAAPNQSVSIQASWNGKTIKAKADGDGEALTRLTIAGEDRKFAPAEAIIRGNSIIVRSEEVSKPVAARFGWGNADIPNLMNKEGLPSSSFRTDDWPIKQP